MFDLILCWIKKAFWCDDCGDCYHDYDEIDDDIISVEDDECKG